jgi:hypothetical protein
VADAVRRLHEHHDFWNELVQSALAAPATTGDIYEPVTHHLGGTAGIVKDGNAVGPVLKGPPD